MTMRQKDHNVLGFLMGKLIIFEHPACLYDYAPGVDLYRMDDKRFFDLELYLNFKRLMNVFNANFEKALSSERSVIAISYNSVLARVVTVCIKHFFGECQEGWKMVSFFHDDKDTQKIIYKDGENAIDEKCALLVDMLNYPSIQKVEIPYNVMLTMPYLNSLFV